MTGNADQAEYWTGAGGDRWLANERLLERQLADIGDTLLDAAAPRPGERVLEIGCGTGMIAARILHAVQPGGELVAVDISDRLLAVARKTAPGVDFRLADAQTAELPGNRDLALSRFGVMFFANPVAGFANIRAALRSGGRLKFVCWAPLADSPFWSIPMAIVARHLGPPDPVPVGTPGPLSLADPVRLRDILTAAGWDRITIETRQVATRQPTLADLIEVAVGMGPAASLINARQPAPALVATIRAEIADVFAGYVTADGAAVPASVHIVGAINA